MSDRPQATPQQPEDAGAVAPELVAPGEEGYDPSKTVLGGKAEAGAVRHPLQNRWTLWFDPPMRYGSQDSWLQNLKEVVTFDTVEDFWRVFNNIQPPSGLKSGCDYHLFKAGIKPQWEDDANKLGGKWLVSLKGDRQRLDKWWLQTILGAIGETFEHEDESVPEEVTGVVISIRNKGDRLALWTKSGEETVVMRIGQQFKETLSRVEGTVPSINFLMHDDSVKSGRSFNNAAHYEL